MLVPPLIVLVLAAWAAGVDPARAGDAPPPAVARDIEILNRMLQQRKAATATPAPPPSAAPLPAPAPSSPAPSAPAPSSRPANAPQPVAAPDAARIAQLIAGFGEEEREARDAARRELVKIGTPAVPDLLIALEDSEMRVRVEAAKALGAIKDPRAAEPLAELLDEPSSEFSDAVYHALPRLGSLAVPAIVDALENSDSLARRRAVRLLGFIGDPAGAEPLIALLNKDRSTGVRVDIAEALGKIKDRAACDALLDALHDW